MGRVNPSSQRRHSRPETIEVYKGDNTTTLRTRRTSAPDAMRSISSRPRQHIPSTLESIGCDKPSSKDKLNHHGNQSKNISTSTSLERKRIKYAKQSLGRSTALQGENDEDNSITNNLPVVSPPSSRHDPMNIKHAANYNDVDVESSKVIELLDEDDSFYVEQAKTFSDSEDSSILEVYSVCSGDSNCTSSVDNTLDDGDPPSPRSRGYCIKNGIIEQRTLNMAQQPQRRYCFINDTAARDTIRPNMAVIPKVQHNLDNIGPYNRCSKSFAGKVRTSTSAAANLVVESSHRKEIRGRKEPYIISPGEIKYFHIERRGAEKQTNPADTTGRSKEAAVQYNSARGSHRSSGLDNNEIDMLDRHQNCNTTYMGHQYGNSKKNVTHRGRMYEVVNEDDRTDDIINTGAGKHKYLHQFSTTLAQDKTIDRSIRTIYKDTHENRPLRPQNMVCSSEEEESVLCDTHTDNSTTMWQVYQNGGNSKPFIEVQDDQYLFRKNRTSGQERISDWQVRIPKGGYFSSSEDENNDSLEMVERSIHASPSRALTHSVNRSPDEYDYQSNVKKTAKNKSHQNYGHYAAKETGKNIFLDQGWKIHAKKKISTRGRSCKNKSPPKQSYHLSNGKQPVRNMEDEDVATAKNYGGSNSESVFHWQVNKNNRQQYAASPDDSVRVLSRSYDDEKYQPLPSNSVGDDDGTEKISEDESYEPSPYERFRNEKVRRNQEYLASLGLSEIKDSLSKKKSSTHKGKKRTAISTPSTLLKKNTRALSSNASEVGLKLSNKSTREVAQVESPTCDSLVAVGDGPCKKSMEKQIFKSATDNKARRAATQDHMAESLSDIKEITRGIREEQMSCFFYARSGKFDKDVGCDVSSERHHNLSSNEKRNALRGATGKLQRCMQCVACLRQDDCFQCTYCRDNIRKGGTYLRKCALRRCVAPLPPRIHNKDDDAEESLEVCKNILSTTRSSTLGEALLKADVKSLFGGNLSPYRLTASSLTQHSDNSQKHANPQRKQRGSGDRPQEECELSSSIDIDEGSLSDKIVLEGFDDFDDSIKASCNNLLDKESNGRCRFIGRSKGAPNQAPRCFAPPNSQTVSSSGKSGADLARSLISFQRSMLPESNDETEAEFSGDDAFNLLVL